MNKESRLGAYKTPAELAALFRRLADAIDSYQLGEEWGGAVDGCYMSHSPHPLWTSRMDACMTINFRDMAPHVTSVLADEGAWMVRDKAIFCV